MKRVDFILIILIVLLIVVGVLWATQSVLKREVLLQPTVQSRVNIDVIIELLPSVDLQEGIDFLLVDPPVTDVPADDNTKGAGGVTTLSIRRGPSSTVNVEICIGADADLASGPFTIPIGGPVDGETYSFDTDPSLPLLPGTFLVIAPGPPALASGEMTLAADTTYYRFWLDVTDPGQAAGTYVNQITFTGQVAVTGTVC